MGRSQCLFGMCPFVTSNAPLLICSEVWSIGDLFPQEKAKGTCVITLSLPDRQTPWGYFKQSSGTLSVFGFYPISSPFPSTKLLSVVFISNFGLFLTLQNWHLDPGFPVGCQHSPLTLHGLFSHAESRCRESLPRVA